MSSMSSPGPAATPMDSSMLGMLGMNMSGSCKSSMLWNWYTVDACFLSTTWHITSAGMFAGSCIGVICLVILLEFFHRVQREYDLLTKRSHPQPDRSMSNEQHVSKPVQAISSDGNTKGKESSPHDDESSDNDHNVHTIPPSTPLLSTFPSPLPPTLIARHRHHTRHPPSIMQQLTRSGLYACQFAVAYMVVLLAMYFNGYVMISFFIGAFLGSFVWGWDLGSVSDGRG